MKLRIVLPALLTAFALPAQAAPATAQAATISAPVAVKAAPAAVKAAPAVVAPDAAAPAKVAQVGVVGVSAVEKPPPPPVVVAPVEQPQQTSRSATRSATRTSTAAAGDLVFTVSGGIATHVGIYTGPGMMIDSPRTGKATSERAIFSGNVYGRF